MLGFADHLPLLPILLPLVAGAVLLLIDERQRGLKTTISIGANVALLILAMVLVVRADVVAHGEPGQMTAYALGNWPVPFGIVLVADRLSSLMVLVAALLGLSAQVYAIARWHQAGPSFHSLFQFLLMGLNGAFLTGDLFNLFVFFEVLLAASYGLALHGSGSQRVRAGLHYIAVNLAASFLFLIGVALIYGVTGTLNMADLALRVADVPVADRGLLQAGAAILGTAFLVKAGMWPLNFWLPTTYAAASAPVAAMFAILTKVGVYVVLRLWLVLFGTGADIASAFGQNLLLYGGMATIFFGSVGVLASQGTARLAGFSVLVSSGTLLSAIGLTSQSVTSGALFYLVSSTLTLGALFFLVELVERWRIAGADVLAVTMAAYGEGEEEEEDDTDSDEVGFVLPGAVAILGLSFALCALLLAGLPPLAGFIAKFAMISAMLNPDGIESMTPVPGMVWVLVTLLMLSGLSALIAMARAGIDIFWVTLEDTAARVRVIEIAPVLALLALCIAMTVLGGPVMRYMDDAAAILHAPAFYMKDVLDAPLAGPLPSEAAP